MSQELSGTVEWFRHVKGFGFIAPDGGGKSLFVHHTGLVMEGYRAVDAGQRVTFVVAEDKNGRPQARSVRVVA